MKTFPKGGIHPRAEKLTSETPISAVAEPAVLTLFLQQGIGAPAKPIVKAGQSVGKYELIAEAGGFVSSPLHSPAHGLVKKIDKARDYRGFWRDAIIIETTAVPPEGWQEPMARSQKEVEALNPEEIVDIVAHAGIVGLGGAAFPTRVKLSPPADKPLDVLIINGAECEPWLTCDDRLMREHAREICEGARLLARAVNVNRIIVGIEENKPQAIACMQECAGGDIEVMELKKKYPQGGEKQLIAACIGRQVPDGCLPMEVRAIVDNVATAYAVYEAVWLRKPLVERVITATGSALTARGNFRVPFGTPLQNVLDHAGGIPEDTGKIVAGGPMMGQAISRLEAPTQKGTGGLLCIPTSEAERKPMDVCIRCAKCVAACPMGLEPYLLMTLGERNLWQEAREHHAMSCIECGCCSYICPSSRPLLDFIKLCKTRIRQGS